MAPTPPWQPDASCQSLEALGEHLATRDFGRLEDEALLSLLLAVSGRDFTRDFREEFGAEDDWTQALGQTARAVSHAFDFLRHDAAIAHLSLLPRPDVLPLLCRFFHLHPRPPAAVRERLSHWLWQRALFDTERSFPDDEARASLALLTDDADATVRALLERVGPPSPRGWERYSQPGMAGLASVADRVEANALLALRPRHLLTGAVLEPGPLLETQGAVAFLPLFPTSPPGLATAPGLGDSLLLTLANQLFHPVLAPGMTLLGLVRTGAPPPAVFPSHALSPEALAALRRSDAPGFLAHRRDVLVTHIRAFIQARTGADAQEETPTPEE
ncbi:hypothetical protein D7Y13_30775 [Corallococcus praedator]|uniref:Uncharacterized protein n=1 Tax=Corallococcus praedator TaxID=2316724 RepID=A0ABX9QC70_9BACT|nr:MULTISPECIES: hypothetical protein [Corallococcus]RKH22783.1 hypothetical protein D7X75_34855 [Corallococcus sp. CA031C]RKH96758.1 hypothetical protein D7Y13_30775 [Corallococcus praedator]